MNDANLQIDLIAKRQKLELLRKRRRMIQENGLDFYRPHYKQDLFHSADYKRRYGRTGNRFGKSEMGAAEDVAWCLGERTWYKYEFPVLRVDKRTGKVYTDHVHAGHENHPFVTVGIPQRPVKGCIIVQDWDKANEIFTSISEGADRGKLFRLIPKDKLGQPKKGRSGAGIAEIPIKSIHGGSSIIRIETVRSFVQNPMGLESSDWDFIHIDEPCPQDMWKAVARGLVDRGGSAWFTCTPLTEPWVNDYFIPRSRTRSEFEKPYVNEDNNLKKWVITGGMGDNPHLSTENIDAFSSELSEHEKACRISGIPLALSGLIYKNFDRDVHIYSKAPHGWKDPQTPPKDYTIRVLIDPHPKTPHAVLFFATSPLGHTFVYRELFRPGLISDLVDHITAVTNGYHVEDYLCDPIAWVENAIDGSCMADEFYKASLPISKAVKDLAYGVLKTEAKFRERDEKEHPTLLVHDSLDEFLFEIDRYIWDPKKEAPLDKDDHMMECLYRAVLTGLSYVSPEPYESNYKPIEVTRQQWHGPSYDKLTDLRPDTKPHTGKSRSQRVPA